MSVICASSLENKCSALIYPLALIFPLDVILDEPKLAFVYVVNVPTFPTIVPLELIPPDAVMLPVNVCVSPAAFPRAELPVEVIAVKVPAPTDKAPPIVKVEVLLPLILPDAVKFPVNVNPTVASLVSIALVIILLELKV